MSELGRLAYLKKGIVLAKLRNLNEAIKCLYRVIKLHQIKRKSIV